MIRPDTYPDHWRCSRCKTAEPHIHQERGDDGVWRHRDYGYDIRDGVPEADSDGGNCD
jgi:hypothetical protein